MSTEAPTESARIEVQSGPPYQMPDGSTQTQTTTTILDNDSTTVIRENRGSDGQVLSVDTQTVDHESGNVTISRSEYDPDGTSRHGTITQDPDGRVIDTDGDPAILDDDPYPSDPPPQESPSESDPGTEETPSDDDPEAKGKETECDASCKVGAFLEGMAKGAVLAAAIVGAVTAVAAASTGAAVALGVGLLAWGAYGIYQTVTGWGGMTTEQKAETAGGIFGGLLGGGLMGMIRRPKAPAIPRPRRPAPSTQKPPGQNTPPRQPPPQQPSPQQAGPRRPPSSGFTGTAKKAKWVKSRQNDSSTGLRNHYRKHGDQVGARNAKEYDISARNTIQNGREFRYRDPTTNEPRVGYWDPQTGFFTATSQTRGTPAILTHFPLSWSKIKRFPGFTL